MPKLPSKFGDRKSSLFFQNKSCFCTIIQSADQPWGWDYLKTSFLYSPWSQSKSESLSSCPLTAHTHTSYITFTSTFWPAHTMVTHLYFIIENTIANWPIEFILGTGATFSRWQGTYVAWPLTGTARAPSLGFPWPNPPYLSLSFHTIHFVLVRWISCYPMQHGQ